jgi:copper homeostasis protein (lipoprotein)
MMAGGSWNAIGGGTDGRVAAARVAGARERTRRSARRRGTIAGVLLLAACGTTAGAPDTPPAASGAVAGWSEELDATFVGELPCADCPGIRVTLTTSGDGSYRMRTVHLGGGGRPDLSSISMGRWIVEPATGRLRLHDRDEVPNVFDRLSDGALRIVDLSGQPLSGAQYLLRRQPTLDPIDQSAEWVGDFVYFADAANFTECGTGRMYPVAMERGYIDLERAYLDVAPGTARPLRVRVSGGFEPRPVIDGAGTEPYLIVDSFVGTAAGSRCPGADAQVGLSDGSWRLAALPGLATPPGAPSGPYLEFTDVGRQVTGDTGCNRLAGSYRQRGTDLTFGALATTRRACLDPQAAEIEQRFVDALERTQWYWIVDGELTLFEGGSALARLRR